MVVTREGSLLPRACQFAYIDESASPVNVLLGSRKFAEGWNCFRVSVIGLVNLGSAKGNKIIQIFGRGVRLQGIEGDGKRTHHPKRVEDYYALTQFQLLEKLETLVVLSLKKSYLKTFTDEVHKQIKYPLSFTVPVIPRIVSFGSAPARSFADMVQKLPVFKLSQTEINQKQVVFCPDHRIKYRFWENQIPYNQTIEPGNWKFALDYRSDRTREGANVANELKQYAGWFGQEEFTRQLQEFETQTQFRLYREDKEGNVGTFTLADVFASEVIIEVLYDEPLEIADIARIRRLQERASGDLWARLKNKINYLINSQRYIFNEPLRQASATEPGDFAAEYVVRNIYESEPDLEAEKHKWTKRLEKLVVPHIPHHLYTPLLLADESEEGWKISPTGLNAGERKLVEDLEEYLQNWPRETGLEFYLLRNVETLKSLGFYMPKAQHVFYPDFVFWIIDPATNTYYFNFLDPKGVRGLQDNQLFDINEKGDNRSILETIEEQFKAQTPYRNIHVNSFILLRDSSDLRQDEYQEAVDRNIFRLNWSEKDEKGQRTTKTEWYKEEDSPKSYLDLLFGKLGLR